MDFFSLSIPHLIISSKQTIDKDLELHVLTPFGHMDIAVSAAPGPGNNILRLGIRVEGNIGSWMLAKTLPSSFRKTIIEFVGRLALRCSGHPMGRPYELYIHFIGESGTTCLTGHLTPYAFASAGG